MSLKPFVGRMFVESVDGKEGEYATTESGLIASVGHAATPFVQGVITAVGKGYPIPDRQTDRGVERAKMEVKVGDIVTYVGSSAVKIDYDGKQYLIISEKEIYAIDPVDGREI